LSADVCDIIYIIGEKSLCSFGCGGIFLFCGRLRDSRERAQALTERSGERGGGGRRPTVALRQAVRTAAELLGRGGREEGASPPGKSRKQERGREKYGGRLSYRKTGGNITKKSLRPSGSSPYICYRMPCYIRSV